MLVRPQQNQSDTSRQPGRFASVTGWPLACCVSRWRRQMLKKAWRSPPSKRCVTADGVTVKASCKWYCALLRTGKVCAGCAPWRWKCRATGSGSWSRFTAAAGLLTMWPRPVVLSTPGSASLDKAGIWAGLPNISTIAAARPRP